jgi:phosphoribosylglycinamide formyltransferase-1
MRVAILASGSGSNAEALMKDFALHESIEVVLVGSNRRNAGVLERAKVAGVSLCHFTREDLEGGAFLKQLLELKVDWVLLAGFLLKIPTDFCRAFENRILNIHPALLPKYGGKGMFGMNVHEAILDDGEKESGMTIHFVNENYDEGAIAFQAGINISELNSAEEIASSVLKLEHEYYPKIARELILESQRNLE